MADDYITHRCKKSLQARCSIRKQKQPTNGANATAWILYAPDYDCDWDYWHLHNVAAIRFCPFCGEELGE